MSTPRRNSQNQAASSSPGQETAPALTRWFLGLGVLVVAPWLVALAIYAGGDSPEPANPMPARTGSVGRPGPWGTIKATPITVSSPMEYLNVERHPFSRDQWLLPGASPSAIGGLLASFGLRADQVATLTATARPDAQSGGVTVRPTPELIRSLPPETRARLYLHLAQSPLNVDQTQAFRFQAASLDEWIPAGIVSPETRALVEPLFYRYGESLYFADINLVRRELPAEEFHRLFRALNRRKTWLLQLTVDRGTPLDALADYWGRGGRRTDLRSLLESAAEQGSDVELDVVHLLPTLARDFLYRFPRLTPADFERPVIANCLWSSLNFFSRNPDERFLDVRHALDVLKNEYYVVYNNYQLGDVIAFVTANGDVFHVVVYLADDFVFTKNGMSAMAPWSIMKLDEVKEAYRALSESPILIYNRSRQF